MHVQGKGDSAPDTRDDGREDYSFQFILGSNSSLEEDSAVKDGDTVLVKKGIEEDGEWDFKARILQDSLGDDGEWL